MSVEYLGKKKRGNIQKIADRLKVSTAEVESLKENRTRYIINQNTGDVTKIDIAKSPLLLREFGIKKINNKLITGGEIKKGMIVSKDPIPLNIPITGTLYAKFKIEYRSSGNTFSKDIYHDINNEILVDTDTVHTIMLDSFYLQNSTIRDLEEQDIVIVTMPEVKFITRNNIELSFNNMVLRGVALNLCNLYGESVDLNNSDDNNCVKNYMVKSYSKISKTKKLPDDGITPEQIKSFCEEYKIKMVLFDIDKNVICQHTPETKNKSYKNFVGIAYKIGRAHV